MTTTPEERLAWAARFCEKARLRMTSAREIILGYLAEQRIPVKLDTVIQAEPIRGACDASTVYRTLMLFKDLDVVRQVSLRRRVRHFVLNVPGETCGYLICRSCGAIGELALSKPLMNLEQQITAASGYAAVSHEMTFHGICPSCQKARKWNPPAAKLPIRPGLTS